MFEWTSDMSIDNGFIDEDHKKLIDIANRVLLLNRPNRDAEELKRAVRELYDYVKYHFDREEALMREIQYTDTESHHQKHQSFVKEMNHYLTSSHHMHEMLDNFQKLMHEWVIHHIMEEDRKLNNFMKSRTPDP
ncbi:MAG: hemerythrin family protein [Candidatus Marinimicrobia bacterium]|jgi:hemerythrin|nr:hemerythrin family protein [Candidatus Neomarinimicrobiota bacterium]MBT3631127.1 hemerythrin family protein [Candidatus Neomarinimicrobiota bacterium]MBT3825767.1 hemerythrin family protein [Candidatus Neomarinimicrobiota bacterium]MBT4130489.1 hemerythrin family protein [Candidatus Neomarinimicrobiota bacterium]MBT4297066.1 hemerythrin family protein [Candidatus Neomarinimicrobiota bacterium]